MECNLLLQESIKNSILAGILGSVIYFMSSDLCCGSLAIKEIHDLDDIVLKFGDQMVVYLPSKLLLIFVVFALKQNISRIKTK